MVGKIRVSHSAASQPLSSSLSRGPCKGVHLSQKINDNAISLANAILGTFGSKSIPHVSQINNPPYDPANTRPLQPGEVRIQWKMSELHNTPRYTPGHASSLVQAISSLGKWEARAVAFVLGCGLGAIMRMIFMLCLISLRTITPYQPRSNETQEAEVGLLDEKANV